MIRKLFTSLLLFIISTTILTAQTGKITGKVFDAKSSETLVGVSVIIKGEQQRGAVTDIDGNFTIENVPVGTHIVSASYIGYTTKEISEVIVKASDVVNLDVSLSEQSTLISEVVITATRKQEAISTVLAIQKNSVTVSDVMSGEAIRRSPDRNTSEVIRRVSGISIQDNRFPIVRGLSDRYNTALVNGVVLPSTEPDRKAFSFDIFPAALIDNIIVNKAATPEMPGDFAGGLIQLNTKDIPAENFFNAQVSLGVNSQTQGNDYFQSTNRGTTDWLGISDKTRNLPEKFPSAKEFTSAPSRQQGELSKLFPNDWGVSKISAMPNIGVQLSSGFIKKMGDNRSLGGVFALTYNNSVRNTEIDRAEYLQTEVLRRFSDRRYTSNVLSGFLANFAFNINANHKISFKNTLNINTDDITTIRTGQVFDGTEGYIKGSLFRYRENRFLTSQLVGEHRLTEGGVKLKWILGYNKINRDLPNQRQITYINTSDKDEAGYIALVGNSVNPNGVGKLFSYLDEKTYIGNIDLAVPVHKNHNIKVGLNYQNRDRLFDARAFGVVRGDLGPALSNQKQDVIFRTENIGFDKFYYGELTDASYQYEAQTSTIAPFVMIDNKLTEKLRAVWGVRYETYPVKLTSSQLVDQTFSAVLPSLNMTYSLYDKTNLRFCASQTLARPELRELAPFSFYDYEVNRTIKGNTGLKQTKIINLDLRYEWFPEGGQLFSVSAFYKRFTDPIEEIFNTTGAGTLLTDYTNAVSANSIGAELEFRKNLSFLGAKKVFEDIVVFSNIAYIQTDVTFKGTGANSVPLNINRPLQGQSPYVLNVGIQYSNIDNGWGTTLLFNQIGKRISFVGSADFPSVVELPRPLLDFQVSKRFKKSEIRLSVSDILNARYRFFQDWNNDLEFNSADSLFINQRQGTTVSISFAYKL
jgi:outer membrane receptor protein involved in Fe transport